MASVNQKLKQIGQQDKWRARKKFKYVKSTAIDKFMFDISAVRHKEKGLSDKTLDKYPYAIQGSKDEKYKN